jgi:hypothetical protein
MTEHYTEMDLGVLLHRIIANIQIDEAKENIDIKMQDGQHYRFFHNQCCCEAVYVEDVDGDLSDLLNSPVLLAECVSEEGGEAKGHNSHTWTFYKLATFNGTVTIRWFGGSNGYYSEGVDFVLVTQI